MRTVRPLAWAGATAFAVLFGCLCALPSAAFLPLAGILLFIGILLGIANRQLDGGVTVLFIVFLTAGLMLGRLALAWRAQKPIQALADETPHTVTAAVLDVENGLYQNVYGAKLRITALDGKACRPFCAVCQDMQNPQIGQQLQGEVEFIQTTGSARLSLLARGVSIRCLQSGTGGLAVQGRASGLQIFFAGLRHRLGSCFLLLGRRQGGLAAAMVVGDKFRLDDGSRTLFRTAGISHLLVVSGLHLTVMASLFAKIFRRKCGPRVGNLLCCIPVFVIMLLTGLTYSVVRAGIMLLFALLAPVAFRRQDALNSLGAAMLLLLLCNPFAAWDMGLQLSFAATLGTICFRLLTAGGAENDKPPFRLARRCLHAALLPLLVSLFTLPIIALQGGSVGMATLLCNMICVPFMGVILCTGWVFLASHLVGTGELLLSGRLLSGLLAGMEWTAEKMTQWFPHSIGISGVWVSVIFGAGLVVAAVWYRSRLQKYFWLAGLCFVAVCTAAFAWRNAGCVWIAPVGEAANPSVVVSCGGECCVIFRGQRTNLQEVQSYLQQHNLSQPATVISLSEQDFSAEIVSTLGRLDWQPGQTQSLYCGFPDVAGVQLSVLSQKEGYLVLLSVQNYTVGVCSGSIVWDTYPQISAFLAGISAPEGLQTGLLFGCREPAWLAQVQCGQASFAENISLWLRPGKAVRILHTVQAGDRLT